MSNEQQALDAAFLSLFDAAHFMINVTKLPTCTYHRIMRSFPEDFDPIEMALRLGEHPVSLAELSTAITTFNTNPWVAFTGRYMQRKEAFYAAVRTLYEDLHNEQDMAKMFPGQYAIYRMENLLDEAEVEEAEEQRRYGHTKYCIVREMYDALIIMALAGVNLGTDFDGLYKKLRSVVPIALAEESIGCTPAAGDSLTQFSRNCLELAQLTKKPWQFLFNGIPLTAKVPPEDCDATGFHNLVDDIKIFYESERDRAAKEYWTPERLADQARKIEQNRARDEVKRDKVNALLAAGKHMTLAPGKEAFYQSLVDANSDSMGKGVMDYANALALMLEKAFAETPEPYVQAIINDKADTLADEADVFGMSGASASYAMSVIAQSWIHGDAFQVWRKRRW